MWPYLDNAPSLIIINQQQNKLAELVLPVGAKPTQHSTALR